MPALVFWKRRWAIASDDFVFPGIFELVLRISWFLSAVALYMLNRNQILHCPKKDILDVYLLGLAVLMVLIVFLVIAIVKLSASGSIYEINTRRNMPVLLYVKAGLSISEVGWNIIGTYWAFVLEDHQCIIQDIHLFVKGTIILEWLLLVIKLFSVYVIYDPLGKQDRKEYDPEQAPAASPIQLPLRAAKVWEHRFKLLFCCVNVDDEVQNAYQDIAELFALVWKDSNLVPSDIVAGLIILAKKQAVEHKPLKSVAFLNREDVDAPRATLDAFPSPACQQWMTIKLAARYLLYARGSYGWPMIFYQRTFTGLCYLCPQLGCCMCCKKSPDYFVEDNCCRCNMAALRSVTGLTDDEFIYVSFHNSIFEVPFFVAVDKITTSIVVAVRGTMSLADILTDFVACNEVLCEEGCPQGITCHKGMLRCAAFVKNKLLELNILEKAFSLYPQYSLVITGHSLGAGIAAILAFLLRPLYPNLKCYTFAPSCSVCLEGVKHSLDFIFSIVVGDDIAPRLCVYTFEIMKQELLKCLTKCKLPKYKILLGADVTSTKISKKSHNKHKKKSHSSKNKKGSKVKSYTDSKDKSDSSEGSTTTRYSSYIQSLNCHMYAPGRILYIRHTKTGFSVRWVTGEFFDRIVVSPKLVSDHIPHFLQEILDTLSKDSSLLSNSESHMYENGEVQLKETEAQTNEV